MVTQGSLVFDARKIYFFGLLIALLYGTSPVLSYLLFEGYVPDLANYLTYFLVCLLVFLAVGYPANKVFSSRIEVDETKLKFALVILAAGFIVVQISLYGDFTRAFVVAYTERTGTELSGGLRFIFYPITSAYSAAILLFSTHLYVRRDRITALNILLLVATGVLFFALGSRNLLLWSFSAVLSLVLSRLSYKNILVFVFFIYLISVLFVFGRNNGLVAYLVGNVDQLNSSISWGYFDPLIHEFGSSYRTFNLITGNPVATQQLGNAPYGLLSSFFINQLPSFMKPSDFISFTDYTSLLFAARGEGIGSSPMTEAYLSEMSSILALIFLISIVYWPAYYLRNMPILCFFTYTLVMAISFNIWRIGSAEILKMFLSSIFSLVILAAICRFKILEFKTNN